MLGSVSVDSEGGCSNRTRRMLFLAVAGVGIHAPGGKGVCSAEARDKEATGVASPPSYSVSLETVGDPRVWVTLSAGVGVANHAPGGLGVFMSVTFPTSACSATD